MADIENGEEIITKAPSLEEMSKDLLNVSNGFAMMQPIWDKFRNDVEQEAKELKKQNAKRLEAKQKELDTKQEELEAKQGELDALAQKFTDTRKAYEQKIESIERENAEKMREMAKKHQAQIESLKYRVRSTLNESDGRNGEAIPEEMPEGGYTGDDGGCNGGKGTDISTKFEGDVTAEGDIFAGNKYAVKSNAEGDASGLSELLDNFGSSAQAASPSVSNVSELKMKIDTGGTMTGNENVMIQNKSLKINIGSNKDSGDVSSDDDDDETDYVNLQEKDLNRRLRRWEKRSALKEATAFAGPNQRIIELVFEDQKEEYFDYLIQDVLPKLDDTQLRAISSYIERYSVIDLTQRNYDYRYLRVFFYCSPRTAFDKLLMCGRYVESKDIRNLVKALDTRKRPTSITLIDLSYCKFEATALIELECLLSYSPHIILNGLTESTVVYANKEVKFSAEHATQLAKTIARQEQRMFVGLSYCSWNFQLMTAFTSMMPKLRMLTLRFCTLDQQAAASLAEGIKSKRHLMILDLCDTKLDESSFAYIYQCMGVLQSLFLSSVMLREGGIDWLLKGLPLIGAAGMECLDISFNPINQDSITRLVETSQDKIKAILFSKEQIQSPTHREIMRVVKRDGMLDTTSQTNENLGESSTDAELKEGSSVPQSNSHNDVTTSNPIGEIADLQTVIGVPPQDQYCFWTLLRAKQIPYETKRYIASITDQDIQRRTLQNTWYQCFQCGTNVAFFGDKIDLLEPVHFLRDRKFFGLYQNSHCVIVTRAEDDNSDQSNKSSSVMVKLVGTSSLLQSKHACNLQCSVNGMNIRTYKCRSCGEPLGLYYHYSPPRINQLNAIWCLLQDDPALLRVGATSKFARSIKEKRKAFTRRISTSMLGGKQGQVGQEEDAEEEER